MDSEPLTIAGHHAWRESITSQSRDFDEIDHSMVDPYECHAPSRRSDKDLGRLLDLLDSLEIGNDRKATTR